MNRNTDQEPTITTEKFGGDDMTIMDHPAFGQITVNRVSGSRTLYGSDFRHDAYVRVTIKRSQLHRNHSRDWYYDKGEIITVDLSEAQWATFVSSFGVGSGVPCTIAREALKGVPTIPFRDEAQEFKIEASAALTAALDEIKALRAAVEENVAGMSKAKQGSLMESVRKAERSLSDSLPFIADQMAEHMEKRVEKAKVEVNAYATATVMRLGLDALNDHRRDLGYDAPVLPISIEDKSDGR